LTSSWDLLNDAKSCSLAANTALSLVGEQNKYSGNNRQSNRKTDNKRNNRMPTALKPSGLGTLLRCSNSEPEGKVAHRSQARL